VKKNILLNTHSLSAFCDSIFFAEHLRYRHRSDKNLSKLYDIYHLFVCLDHPHLHMCDDTLLLQQNNDDHAPVSKFLPIGIILYSRHPRHKYYRILCTHDTISASISSHIYQI